VRAVGEHCEVAPGRAEERAEEGVKQQVYGVERKPIVFKGAFRNFLTLECIPRMTSIWGFPDGDNVVVP